MSNIHLAGLASTQSRGRRPLPPGAVSARTLSGSGVYELTEFTFSDGWRERRQLLTWIVGQHGCLWHNGPYPDELLAAAVYPKMPGTYGHAAEYALADVIGEALDGIFTSADLACRFYQDGGTALAAAARLARHATGRSQVASFGYHGASAEWAHEPATAGILADDWVNHRRFDWGDVDKMEIAAMQCAAVCVEVPPVTDDDARTFLGKCRKACDMGGAVFILDEVVTGFRGHVRGMAGITGVKPDIACYGKAIASRGRLSAVVGRRDLVEPIGGEVFLSTTFGGHPDACADGAATIRYLMGHPELYDQMNTVGSELVAGLNALGIKTVGQPTRSVMQFASDNEWLAFCSESIARGVALHRPQFVTAHHTHADVTKTLSVAEQIQHATT